MKSFNEELDELLITLDYGSSDIEGFDFMKEEMIRHTLLRLKSHIKILRTLDQYESSKIETETLKDMYTSLSEPDSMKGMTGNNHVYKFLELVSNFICYSKFNCKYHGDKPEEIPMVLDNLNNYINELISLSKQRTLDNCKDDDERAAKKRWIEFLDKERTMLDNRAI